MRINPPPADPLQVLFGRKATRRPLLGTSEPLVHHADASRLPAFLRTGPMASLEALCSRYTGPVQGANGSLTHGAQHGLPLTASQVLSLGLTAYFVDVVPLLDGADRWLRDLERSLGVPTGCARLMAFSNAPGSGLPLHHDVYDQVLIHLHGKKTIDLARNHYVEQPAMQFRPEEPAVPAFGPTYQSGFPKDSQTVLDLGLERHELRPGTAVYLPGGCWHATAGQTEPTLSVTLLLQVPSRLEVLTHHLALWLTQSAYWRGRPYGAWGDDAAARQQQLRDDLQALSAQLPDLDVSEAHAAWALSQAIANDHRGWPDSVRWSRYIRLPEARLRWHAEPVTGQLVVEVRLGTHVAPRRRHSFGLPLAAEPLLPWIESLGRAFTVAEAEAAHPEVPDLADALATLAANELIRPIAGPPYPG